MTYRYYLMACKYMPGFFYSLSSSQASMSLRAMESFSGNIGRFSLVNHLPRESSSFCRWISPSTYSAEYPTIRPLG